MTAVWCMLLLQLAVTRKPSKSFDDSHAQGLMQEQSEEI